MPKSVKIPQHNSSISLGNQMKQKRIENYKSGTIDKKQNSNWKPQSKILDIKNKQKTIFQSIFNDDDPIAEEDNSMDIESELFRGSVTPKKPEK